jgi:hypothetical protein
MPPEKRQLPPPPHQIALSFVVERLKVVVPPPALVLILLVVVPSAAVWTGLLTLAPPETPPILPSPARPTVPLQEWATDGLHAADMLAVMLAGRLPPPDTTRQRKPPCKVKLGEQAINGWCWLELAVRPPCPTDSDAYAYEHDGRCFGYALKVPGPATTGEPQAGSVAGEP